MKKKNTALVQQQKVHEESQQYTWIAQISNIIRLKRKLPKDYIVWPLQEKDKSRLAELYFVSYTREVVKNLAEAQKEMNRVFRNEYGLLDYSASFVAIYRSKIVASVLLVEQAPWEDTPSGPFIIEMMVHPDHRLFGIAECLMIYATNKLVESGAQTIALRVISDNIKAINLYCKCGFKSWNSVRK